MGKESQARNTVQRREGGAVPFGAREDDDVEEEEFARSGAQAAVGLSPRRPAASCKAAAGQTGARRDPGEGGEPQGVGVGVGGADASAEGAR